MTWSCCRAELGMGEVEEPQTCPGWEGAVGVRHCWFCHCPVTALSLPCHSSVTALSALSLPPICPLCAGVPWSLLWWGGSRLFVISLCPFWGQLSPVPSVSPGVPVGSAIAAAPWQCPVCISALPRASTGPLLDVAAPGQLGWRQELLKDLCKSR